MQSYLVFDVVALWPSHGLVSPYFTDPKTESAQVGGIDHGYNLRSMFYWKIGARAELEGCNHIRKLFILVLLVASSHYFIFIFGAYRDLFEKTMIDAKTFY